MLAFFFFSRNTSHNKELMENIFVPPLALRGISVNGGSARHKDALRLGMPFHIDAAYFGQGFPCGRLPCFPFPAPFGVCEYSSFEPAFIQKRNERERHRVRCVNEGYARLREHLPQEFEDKRLSKVETLRAAIDYIKHLQGLLDADRDNPSPKVFGSAVYELDPIISGVLVAPGLTVQRCSEDRKHEAT
uniref:Achaete-scute family bHLH transcription factor 4 n=1 Tax=Xiphophorus maculatus TaxID=8083 RepID=A0A3B5QV35_XIPMA